MIKIPVFISNDDSLPIAPGSVLIVPENKSIFVITETNRIRLDKTAKGDRRLLVKQFADALDIPKQTIKLVAKAIVEYARIYAGYDGEPMAHFIRIFKNQAERHAVVAKNEEEEPYKIQSVKFDIVIRIEENDILIYHIRGWVSLPERKQEELSETADAFTFDETVTKNDVVVETPINTPKDELNDIYIEHREQGEIVQFLYTASVIDYEPQEKILPQTEEETA